MSNKYKVIKLTSFGTYRQKMEQGICLAPKKYKVYKIAVEYHTADC